METIEKTIKIEKRYGNYDELFTSEEFSKLWKGFQGAESQARIFRRFQFIGAFKVVRDPFENYGRPFDLYVHYVAEGVITLKKLEISSSLTNQPLRKVIVHPEHVDMTNQFYAKNNNTNEFLKKFNITVY